MKREKSQRTGIRVTGSLNMSSQIAHKVHRGVQAESRLHQTNVGWAVLD